VHRRAEALFFSFFTNRATQVHVLAFDYFTENATKVSTRWWCSLKNLGETLFRGINPTLRKKKRKDGDIVQEKSLFPALFPVQSEKLIVAITDFYLSMRVGSVSLIQFTGHSI
jgi:hypothetical protein